MKILKRKFFERDPKIVAKELLGKAIVRKIDGKILSGKIVETEAYYGKNDPASRAHYGKPKYVVELMKGLPGKLLIYMVHSNWLLNVVAHPKRKVGAVLIRAVEPLEGIDEMLKNRKVKRIKELTNGPGKLTKALKIDKSLNGVDVTNENSSLIFVDYQKIPKKYIGESFRIGVKKDLKVKLRFFIKQNQFVSKI